MSTRAPARRVLSPTRQPSTTNDFSLLRRTKTATPTSTSTSAAQPSSARTPRAATARSPRPTSPPPGSPNPSTRRASSAVRNVAGAAQAFRRASAAPTPTSAVSADGKGGAVVQNLDEEVLRARFDKADVQGKGTLAKGMFEQLCNNCGITLTRTELNFYGSSNAVTFKQFLNLVKSKQRSEGNTSDASRQRGASPRVTGAVGTEPAHHPAFTPRTNSCVDQLSCDNDLRVSNDQDVCLEEDDDAFPHVPLKRSVTVDGDSSATVSNKMAETLARLRGMGYEYVDGKLKQQQKPQTLTAVTESSMSAEADPAANAGQTSTTDSPTTTSQEEAPTQPKSEATTPTTQVVPQATQTPQIPESSNPKPTQGVKTLSAGQSGDSTSTEDPAATTSLGTTHTTTVDTSASSLPSDVSTSTSSAVVSTNTATSTDTRKVMPADTSKIASTNTSAVMPADMPTSADMPVKHVGLPENTSKNEGETATISKKPSKPKIVPRAGFQTLKSAPVDSPRVAPLALGAIRKSSGSGTPETPHSTRSRKAVVRDIVSARTAAVAVRDSSDATTRESIAASVHETNQAHDVNGTHDPATTVRDNATTARGTVVEDLDGLGRSMCVLFECYAHETQCVPMSLFRDNSAADDSDEELDADMVTALPPCTDPKWVSLAMSRVHEIRPTTIVVVLREHAANSDKYRASVVEQFKQEAAAFDGSISFDVMDLVSGTASSPGWDEDLISRMRTAYEEDMVLVNSLASTGENLDPAKIEALLHSLPDPLQGGNSTMATTDTMSPVTQGGSGLSLARIPKRSDSTTDWDTSRTRATNATAATALESLDAEHELWKAVWQNQSEALDEAEVVRERLQMECHRLRQMVNELESGEHVCRGECNNPKCNEIRETLSAELGATRESLKATQDALKVAKTCLKGDPPRESMFVLVNQMHVLEQHNQYLHQTNAELQNILACLDGTQNANAQQAEINFDKLLKGKTLEEQVAVLRTKLTDAKTTSRQLGQQLGLVLSQHEITRHQLVEENNALIRATHLLENDRYDENDKTLIPAAVAKQLETALTTSEVARAESLNARTLLEKELARCKQNIALMNAQISSLTDHTHRLEATSQGGSVAGFTKLSKDLVEMQTKLSRANVELARERKQNEFLRHELSRFKAVYDTHAKKEARNGAQGSRLQG